MAIRSVQIQVMVPVPPGTTEADVGPELLRLWLIEQVRLRRMGVGKAAELSSLPRADFMQLLGVHGVPVIDHTVDELDRELARFSV
jgi:predicted HTH domain antitoxin